MFCIILWTSFQCQISDPVLIGDEVVERNLLSNLVSIGCANEEDPTTPNLLFRCQHFFDSGTNAAAAIVSVDLDAQIRCCHFCCCFCFMYLARRYRGALRVPVEAHAKIHRNVQHWARIGFLRGFCRSASSLIANSVDLALNEQYCVHGVDVIPLLFTKSV